MVPVLIFGPIVAWGIFIVIALAKAAATDIEVCEAHMERKELSCLPLTEPERTDLFVEAESITREACYR
jgi:hypothetical protein